MPRRPIVLSAAALCAALVLALSGRDAGAQPLPGTLPPEPDTVSGCADFVNAERRLERELPNLQPAGPRGAPRLCLLYYALDDAYRAVLLTIDSSEQFRAVKANAARALLDAGVDLCKIGAWGSYGRRPAGDASSADDFFTLPVPCAPRVLAAPGDARATEVAGSVRETMESLAPAIQEMLGATPSRPLTIVIVAEEEPAVRTYVRHSPPDEWQRAEELARDGRSVNQCRGSSPYGCLMTINLVGQVPLAVTGKVAHEYGHHVQHLVGGGTAWFPKWFVEGQAVFVEGRFGGLRSRYLARALATRRDGTAPRLADLATADDWEAAERQHGTVVAYGQGYAAVRYLAERFGFEATAQLLRDNRNGSLGRFNEQLARLTGLSLAAFDRAVEDWLVALRWYVATDERAGIEIEYVLGASGDLAEGEVRTARQIPCVGVMRAINPRSDAFQLTRRADGSWSGAGGGGTVHIALAAAEIGEGGVRGTWRYRSDTGCDSGPIAFTARALVAAPRTALADALGEEAGGLVAESPVLR